MLITVPGTEGEWTACNPRCLLSVILTIITAIISIIFYLEI